jgi:hypothetical protein
VIIKYSNNAVNQFSKIHKGDKKSAEMIVHKLEQYAERQSGAHDAKNSERQIRRPEKIARRKLQDYFRGDRRRYADLRNQASTGGI